VLPAGPALGPLSGPDVVEGAECAQYSGGQGTWRILGDQPPRRKKADHVKSHGPAGPVEEFHRGRTIATEIALGSTPMNTAPSHLAQTAWRPFLPIA